MALKAYGNIRLLRDAPGSPGPAAIAGVKNLDGPGTQLAFIETTDFDSTGGFREYVGTLKDPGQMSFTLNFDPDSAGHEALCDDHDAAVARTFQLEFSHVSPPRIWEFDAFVAEITPKAEVDGLIEAQVTLRVTGNIDRDA